MLELFIACIIFLSWSSFATLYYRRYKRINLSNDFHNRSFWRNEYLFNTIPSVFPTLGIFCTALGITIGIWDFNVDDIQGSIPELLGGLRLAFFATMAGIIGLISFQKWNALIQKDLDENPSKPLKVSNELEAIQLLCASVQDAQNSNDKILSEIGEKIDRRFAEMREEIKESIQQSIKELIEVKGLLSTGFGEVNKKMDAAHTQSEKGYITIQNHILEGQSKLWNKFDGFSELLSKNNTEALVEVMKNVTAQFNQQMNELISRLVQENFSELNSSVQSMNAWQQENRTMIETLTAHFQKTTELFEMSSKVLTGVADKTELLVASDGKLAEIVTSLEKVLITDDKLYRVTTMVFETTQSLKNTTESFEEMTSKLNEWVRTERNFKDSADVLILKLEEFRDLNSDVWKRYREEMTSAVSIIKTTSSSLEEDLTNINKEFYDRLDETLKNLDLCIQRFIPGAN